MSSASKHTANMPLESPFTKAAIYDGFIHFGCVFSKVSFTYRAICEAILHQHVKVGSRQYRYGKTISYMSRRSRVMR